MEQFVVTTDGFWQGNRNYLKRSWISEHYLSSSSSSSSNQGKLFENET